MKRKKLWILALLVIWLFRSPLNIKNLLITLTPAAENIFLTTTISYLDSKDKNNIAQPAEILFSLFIQTMHEIYVKDEIQSFKMITRILSKPFFNFWIVHDIVRFIVRTVYYIVNEIRKYLCIFVISLLSISLPFVLLFYLKTHLKTRRFAPMVLRC